MQIGMYDLKISLIEVFFLFWEHKHLIAGQYNNYVVVHTGPWTILEYCTQGDGVRHVTTHYNISIVLNNYY
jgi:hypothetical protein